MLFAIFGRLPDEVKKPEPDYWVNGEPRWFGKPTEFADQETEDINEG